MHGDCSLLWPLGVECAQRLTPRMTRSMQCFPPTLLKPVTGLDKAANCRRITPDSKPLAGTNSTSLLIEPEDRFSRPIA